MGGLILALRKSACGTAVIDLENYFGRLLGAVFPDLRGRVAVLRAEKYELTTFPEMYSNLKVFILPVFLGNHFKHIQLSFSPKAGLLQLLLSAGEL